jgi:[ribosomal protein S5]-alanine N-acetyltransferase
MGLRKPMSSDPSCLITSRLTLIPFSTDLLRLALTERETLERRLSARFLPQWNAENQLKILNGVLRALEADPTSRVWRFYFILHTADRAVIGDAGFKGPPDHEGSVEVAYGVVPAYRRKGYAFEAAQALVRWAFLHPQVRQVTAGCDDENVGSIRILEKLGMHRVGVSGKTILWALPRIAVDLDPG